MANEITVRGGHLARDGQPWRIRGVTYGSFLPRRSDGALFPEAEQIEADLQAIARNGLNTIRTYTLPTRELLDAAGRHGLQVIAGLHYDDWRTLPDAPAAQVRRNGLAAVGEAMERCGDHPATLAICVGNEVLGDLVRTIGPRTVEAVLTDLIAEVHRLSSTMLATYANYPTTEYLRVEGQDFASFNVFLEDPGRLRSYLQRLQVQAGEIPVLLSEVGLASEVHGETEQASQLAEQLRVTDEVGLAGACVFSWTDEWGVAGEPVEGWGFGLTTSQREEKLALREIREWALRDLSDLRLAWPRVTVVVCAYNEQQTITECLASVTASSYPDLEIVVCDDGSTDATLAQAQAFADDPRVAVLALPHGGLSRARNAGMDAATGDIIAYLDADAACHPDWVHHLALSLESPGVVGTGGPNHPVPDAGLVERAVSAAPGGPLHVLTSHDRAEHVPGCNMAFHAEALRGIGGFNPVYTSAGDDVDVCWKLLDRGGEIAFSAAATVLHHRRSTVSGYLRQQRGYGHSERMLSGPHAHRFNQLGQARWAGVIYGSVLRRVLRPVVYHGVMGTAPYQPSTRLRGQAVVDGLGALLPLTLPLAMVGLLASPISLAWLALTGAMLTIVGAYATVVAIAARPNRHEPTPLRFRALVAALHVVQPFVRTWGRLRGRPAPVDLEVVRPRWTGDRFVWLAQMSTRLQARGLHVRPAPHDSTDDLVISRTPLARTRLASAVLWRWTPVARCRTTVRWPGLAVLAAAAIPAVAVGGPAGWALAALLVTAVAADAALLHRLVRGVLAEVTAGAAVDGVAAAGADPAPAAQLARPVGERAG